MSFFPLLILKGEQVTHKEDGHTDDSITISPANS